MKYYDICRHCKKDENCKGYVERTEDNFCAVYFCPKFIHDNGTPFSQADKIRSMSDEELAEFLANFAWDNEPTKKETYEWLQSEVEVSDER